MLKREGVPFWPDVAWRDVVFGVLVAACIVFLAWHFVAPELTTPPDPTFIQAYPRPDWYLLWYFAVLAQLSHGIENYVIVGAPLLASICLFILPRIFNRGQRVPSQRPWAVASIVLIVMSVRVLWFEGEPASPDFSAKPLTSDVVHASSADISHGAGLLYAKGCEYCHAIAGSGGHRGPDLTSVADRLTEQQITLRVLNGGYNMPSFASSLKRSEPTSIVAFLKSRNPAAQANNKRE